MQGTNLTIFLKRCLRAVPGLWLLPLCLLAPVGAAQEVAGQPETPATALERSAELQEREQAIEELQSEFGIYSPELVEAYGDFAAFYASMEDYDAAIALYTSALQIARITTGLYSVEQLPLLQRLIDNNAQLKNWEEVDKLEDLRYLISSRVFALGDEDYLLAATAYGEWKLHVIRENLLEMHGRGLVRETEALSGFYERVIANLESQTDASQEDLLQMLYGKSIADLSLARTMALTPASSFEGTVSRYITQTRCENGRNAQGQVVRQCYNVQVENPRYRRSQQDAKQYAVSQYTREVSRAIDKLQYISDQSVNLSPEQRQSLDSHIGELQTESTQLLRAARRRSLF